MFIEIYASEQGELKILSSHPVSQVWVRCLKVLNYPILKDFMRFRI